MCLIDEAEPSKLWTTTEIKRAREQHKCDECNRVINAGEPYRKHFFVDDYGANTHRLCAHCTKAALLLVEQCGGYLVDGILEDLEQHSEWLGDYPWSRLAARYRVGIGRRWQRFDGAGLMAVPK